MEITETTRNTKFIRLKIYKQALTDMLYDIQHPDNHRRWEGICVYIDRVVGLKDCFVVNPRFNTGDDLERNFPEIWKHKPKKEFAVYEFYWFGFTRKDMTKRVNILKSAIKEIEKQILQKRKA
jgi:hypothetical protein